MRVINNIVNITVKAEIKMCVMIIVMKEILIIPYSECGGKGYKKFTERDDKS